MLLQIGCPPIHHNTKRTADRWSAGEKYIGIAYAEEIGKIKDAFQAVIEPLRDTSMKSVQKAIADARTSINSVVSKPMDAELTQTIDIVRKIAECHTDRKRKRTGTM